MKRISFLGVRSKRSCRSSYNHQLQLLRHYWWGIDLDYSDIMWFALEMNRDHSVVFEIASKYCISDPFVDYAGYSISSKGFLHMHFILWLKAYLPESACLGVSYSTLLGKSYTYMKVISQFVLL